MADVCGGVTGGRVGDGPCPSLPEPESACQAVAWFKQYRYGLLSSERYSLTVDAARELYRAALADGATTFAQFGARDCTGAIVLGEFSPIRQFCG